ncbi:MAG: sensor histidine kinase [Actinomycetota bacterium]
MDAPGNEPGAFPHASLIGLYVGLVGAAGGALTLWLVLSDRFHLDVIAPGVFWPGGARRLMFAAFVLLSELLPLTIPRGTDTEEVTTSSTFAFGLVLGWGVGWGVTALVASTVIADLIRRKPPRKIVFNAGQYALAIGAAGVTYTALGGKAAIGAGDLPPMLAAAAAFFIVNNTLTAIAVSVTQGTSIVDHIKANIVFNAMVSGVLLSLSPVVVILAENSPILVPLLALPLAAVYLGASALLKNSRLQELNQLKDDFVAMVSHELRTPLTSIQGSVKTLIQLGHDLDEEQRLSFLEAVDRQSDRLRRLIERLLVVARLESDAERVSFAPVPVRTLCEYVVFELRPSAGAHSFQFDFDPELVEVETDEGKVHQILSNLAENALKYSRADSRITIRCRVEAEAVALIVEDQGPGIPEDAHDRIFDRFYQVDQSRTRHVGGTGLGLYICRKLAEAIGGKLTLDAGYHEGCRFVLRLPRRHVKHVEVPHSDISVHQLASLAPNMHVSRRSEPESIPTPVVRRADEITRGRVVAFLSSAES